jgi:hypothetical protein
MDFARTLSALQLFADAVTEIEDLPDEHSYLHGCEKMVRRHVAPCGEQGGVDLSENYERHVRLVPQTLIPMTNLSY